MKKKLIVSFVLIICIFSAVSLMNYIQVHDIKKQITKQNQDLDKKVLTLDLKLKLQELDTVTASLIETKNIDLIETFASMRGDFAGKVEKVAQSANNSEQTELSGEIVELSQQYTDSFDELAGLVKDENIDPVDLLERTDNMKDTFASNKEAMFGIIDRLNESFTAEAADAVTASNSLLDLTSLVSLLGVGIVALLSAVVAILMIRSFLKPIRKLQSAVKAIAEGDLRHKINAGNRDELGVLCDHFDHMIDRVRSMLGNTQSIAASLAEHSRGFQTFSHVTASANAEIARAIDDISLGATQQADYTENCAQLVTDLQNEIIDIGSFTEQMQSTSLEAIDNTERGTRTVNALKQANDLSEQMLNGVFNAMETFAVNSNQIGKIVNTIMEISTQTNILSINAAIEASRAGVLGKGFAVIAEEVRQLSLQTKQSARHIDQMVKTLLTEMQDVQRQLRKAKESIAAQSLKVADTETSFESIRVSIIHLSGHMKQIHLKLGITNRTANGLVDSLQHVSAIAQETAAGVQEVNSTSSEQSSAIRQIADQASDMNRLSQQLFEEIRMFQVDMDGIEADQTEAAETEAEPSATDGDDFHQTEAESFTEHKKNTGVEAGDNANSPVAEGKQLQHT